MEKKESSKIQDMKNPNLEGKILKTSLKSKKQKDKPLPWWVELLFVQIGLPDKLLVKILKTNKNSKEFFNNYKKPVFFILFILTGMTYFYPVVKNSQSKLNCEVTAQSFISKSKNLANINLKELKMLSTNFCNGGSEFYEMKNRRK